MAKPYWEKCKQGKLVRAAMADALPENVLTMWGANRRVDDARLAVVHAGKAYCLARCGGCPLTEGYVPPS